MFAKLNKIWTVMALLALWMGAACAPAASETAAVQPIEPAQPTQAPAEPEKTYAIGMVTIASHPSLDQIQQGVKDSLAQAGFVEGQNLKIISGNAQGDMATMNTIIQQFLDEKVDLIVATTTPAAQTAYKLTQDAQGPPVFFNGVSNPFAAGMAESPEKHPGWMIGTQLLDPVEPTLKLVQDLLPEAKKVGMVFNPAEANSVYLHDLAKSLSEEMGYTLVSASVSNSNEISTAAESLLGEQVDVFLAINDNTVTSGFEAWVKVANDNQIPLIGTSASMPPLGAAASYGINPYQEGLDSGEMVVKYLKGELDIAQTPIRVQEAVLLTVNPGAAQLQGLVIPEEWIEKADKVIE